MVLPSTVREDSRGRIVPTRHPPGELHDSPDALPYVDRVRSMISVIDPIGRYESTRHASEFVLERTRGKLAATLAATLSHPVVVGYLSHYPDEDHASFDATTPSPFAGVLLPLVYGPHMERNLRFLPEDEVEPLVYARAATIAQSLLSARERESEGQDAAHYGALDWIVSCARDLGNSEAFDHFVVYLHDRHVHGRSDEGHNSLSRILSEREQTRSRSHEIYAQMRERHSDRPVEQFSARPRLEPQDDPVFLANAPIGPNL